MKQIYKLFSFIIVALALTSCGDDFDYNPNLDNRTLLDVESYTFNDNNLDNVENYNDSYNDRSYACCYSPTLKAYYENYFKKMTLIKWDNGKYEINTYALRESTDPQKPKKENGKIQLNFKRTKHSVFQWDLYWYYGTIKLVEVEHNRFECEIYDDEYNITFSATLQFKDKYPSRQTPIVAGMM